MELKDIKFDQHNFRKHNSKNQKLVDKLGTITGVESVNVVSYQNDFGV